MIRAAITSIATSESAIRNDMSTIEFQSDTTEGQLSAFQEALVEFTRKRVEDNALSTNMVLISFLNALDESGEPEQVVPWLYRVIRITIKTCCSSAGQECLEITGWPADGATFDEHQRFVGQCFRTILPTIDSDYAELLERVDLGGESVSDVSIELGIAPNNLMGRLRAARLEVRSRFEESCRLRTEQNA